MTTSVYDVALPEPVLQQRDREKADFDAKVIQYCWLRRRLPSQFTVEGENWDLEGQIDRQTARINDLLARLAAADARERPTLLILLENAQQTLAQLESTRQDYADDARALLKLRQDIKYHPYVLRFAYPTSQPVEREAFLENAVQQTLAPFDNEYLSTRFSPILPVPSTYNQQRMHYYDARKPRALHGYKFGTNHLNVKE